MKEDAAVLYRFLYMSGALEQLGKNDQSVACQTPSVDQEPAEYVPLSGPDTENT
ncbi:hypothetical protein BaRGS_00029097, partial [Batillaria attramentaria]